MSYSLKWIGVVGGLLLLLLAATAGVLTFRAGRQLNGAYDIEPPHLELPVDEATLARGRHIAEVSCVNCHGADYGGADLFANEALGYIPAPNLTAGAGGIGARYDVEDWVRALRHGVNHEGEPLVIMPADALRHLGDEDLAALIAFMQQLPPVDRGLPERSFTLLGQALIGAGAFGNVVPAQDIDHGAPPPVASQPGETVAYGQYWVNVTDCNTCHGAQLSGGKDPDPAAPPAPNLTPGGALATWSEADFMAVMRTGQTPDGRVLNPSFMPWQHLGRMSDQELRAVWLYLRSLPPLESTAP